MNKSVILDGVRSPMGIKNGQIIGTRSDDITALAVKGLTERLGDGFKASVEDLALGCAFPEATQGMLMARSVVLLADLPVETGGKVVNRFCGSSMDAAHQISCAVETGDIKSGIAAGVEDMFGVPMGGYNPSFHPELMKKDFYMGMGETAELLAQELDISREDQEEFALNSHKKALAAQAAGKFDNEIIPLEKNGIIIAKDEGPREPNLEKIKTLKPAFLADGTITAATSSPVSMGSAALAIVGEDFAKELGIKPRARIISRAVAGVEWTKMGKGPLPATEKALKFAGKTLADMDAIELNEAFAAQSLYVIRKGNWPIDKINFNGGAIALGHPLGQSGARLLVTLMNVLDQIDGEFGLATMCIGTGQGIATVIQRI